MLVRLESGVGRDMSGGERAVKSAKGSMKVESLSLSLGGIVGCFKVGWAQTGILISTCRGFVLSVPAVAAAASHPGVGGQSDTKGEHSLPLDRKVEKDPDRASG